MRTRRKSYVKKTSARLQGQEDQNDREPLQVQLHQSMNNQLDEQLEESLLIKVKGKNNILLNIISYFMVIISTKHITALLYVHNDRYLFWRNYNSKTGSK
jgi:ribosomal protein RSM22 (predicted rRNA methylase)